MNITNIASSTFHPLPLENSSKLRSYPIVSLVKAPFIGIWKLCRLIFNVIFYPVKLIARLFAKPSQTSLPTLTLAPTFLQQLEKHCTRFKQLAIVYKKEISAATTLGAATLTSLYIYKNIAATVPVPNNNTPNVLSTPTAILLALGGVLALAVCFAYRCRSVPIEEKAVIPSTTNTPRKELPKEVIVQYKAPGEPNTLEITFDSPKKHVEFKAHEEKKTDDILIEVTTEPETIERRVQENEYPPVTIYLNGCDADPTTYETLSAEKETAPTESVLNVINSLSKILNDYRSDHPKELGVGNYGIRYENTEKELKAPDLKKYKQLLQAHLPKTIPESIKTQVKIIRVHLSDADFEENKKICLSILYILATLNTYDTLPAF